MSDKKTSPATSALATLAQYRKEIDAIDNALVDLIHQRSLIVERVKQLKDTYWPAECHIRPGREAAMHAAMFQRFANSPIGAQAGAELWRLIISASTMIESALHIGVLETTESLAKCYFSPLAHYHLAKSANALHELFLRHTVNIAAVPFPDNETNAHILIDLLTANEGLYIFGYAPLVLKEATLPQALMVGRITPEHSGNDWSYFLIEKTALRADETTLAQSGNHAIIRVRGYYKTLDNHIHARFLGAHGVELSLSGSSNSS